MTRKPLPEFWAWTSTPWTFVLALPFFTLSPQTHAQTVDPNAPYADAYDVQTRGRLVGTWKGTISGSSISQAGGQMEGQAVFVERGYDGRDDFGIVLHDHRHREGQAYSEIVIGSVPCGPDGGAIRAVDPVELQNATTGPYATVTFANRLADTGNDDFVVGAGGGYGAELAKPATVITRWTDDSFTLSLHGQFISAVLPVKNHTFDYERQSEGYLDRIHLDVEFTLEHSPETQAAFDWMMCDEPDVFEVVETIPTNGRENVILEGADFFVTFSEELAKGSIDPSTVTMTTRDQNNGFVFVDLELGLENETGAEDDRSLRIAPREPLRSGTIYEIAIAGSDTGVRGRDRQFLEEDYSFFVSTMVDPEEMSLGIYQVSRNAPLVYGKPASARIHLDWEELEDIHPEWQVLSYPVLAEILDTRETTIFPEIQQRVERPDQYTDEDRRLGEHMLDLFGWTPTRARDPRDFRAEVLPADHYPEDVDIHPKVVETWMNYAARHTDRMTIAYYIAEHAEWGSNGAGQEMTGHIHEAVRRERAFINQIFPVARVAAHFQGSYNIETWICGLPKLSDKYCPQNKQNLGMLFQLFDEHISAHSTADILVSYHPPSLDGTGKAFALYEQPETLIYRPGEPHRPGEVHPEVESLRRSDRGNRNMIVMATSALSGKRLPAVVSVPLIAHEVGHVFALPHSPYADDHAHRAEICHTYQNVGAIGIDGMRIALSGETGWQKSSEYGNAEASADMRNLMFPCALDPREEYWIDPAQYDWLVENLPRILNTLRRERAALATRSSTRHAQRAAPLEGLLWRAAFQEEDEEQWLMISGVLDEQGAVLLPAIRVPGPRAALAGDGPYEVHVEDASGRVLARAPVGPGQADDGGWSFSVSVSVQGEPARIVLSRDGEVLGQNRAHPSLKAPEVRSHAPGAVYRAGDTLEWDGEPSDGLTYTVRFTDDGQNWETIAVLLGETRFTPDATTLRPGRQAAFEIIAYDGVRERRTHLPVQVEVPLEPLAMRPLGDTVLTEGEAVEIAFNTRIDASSLDAVTIEADGVPVTARVTLAPSGMALSIAPETPESGVIYTAHIGTALRAEDGRSLDKAIRVEFRMEPLATVVESATWDAARLAILAEDHGDSASADAVQDPLIVGDGEITLEMGELITRVARILHCEVDEVGQLSSLDLAFETMPGDRVDLAMYRPDGSTLATEATLSNGVTFKSRDDGTGNWRLNVEDGQLSVRGSIGTGSDAIAFELIGTCPAE